MSSSSTTTTNLSIPSGDQTNTPTSTSSSITTTSLESNSSSNNNNGELVIASARSSWQQTFFVILSKGMAAGILSLPSAAIELGWVITMLSLLLFAVACTFTGYQIQVVKLHHPEVKSFADAARKLCGYRFGVAVEIALLVTWVCEATQKLIAVADCIGSIYDGGLLSCQMYRTAIAALIFILPSQCRDFHSVGKYLSVPSISLIIVVVIVIAVALIEQLKNGDVDNSNGVATFGQNTTVWLTPDITVFTFFAALGKLTFAYQSQSIFMELISETKDPKSFTKSSGYAFAVMCVMYSFMIIIGYGVYGKNTPDFLPDALKGSAVKTFTGILLVLHYTVSYVVDIQCVHTALHSKVFPKTYKIDNTIGRLHWFFITLCVILISFLIANLIPFFGDVNSLIGSLFGSAIVFGFPSLYYLLSTRTSNTTTQGKKIESIPNKLGSTKTWASYFFLFILFPVFCIFGTIGSVTSLINDFMHSGLPFHC